MPSRQHDDLQQDMTLDLSLGLSLENKELYRGREDST